MKEIITINTKLLAFRDQAKSLAKAAGQQKSPVLAFNFARVEFMSRSFADEFLNVLTDLKARKKTVALNALKPELRHFLTSIQQVRVRTRAEMAEAS